MPIQGWISCKIDVHGKIKISFLFLKIISIKYPIYYHYSFMSERTLSFSKYRNDIVST
jgi:hypothetical protein